MLFVSLEMLVDKETGGCVLVHAVQGREVEAKLPLWALTWRERQDDATRSPGVTWARWAPRLQPQGSFPPGSPMPGRDLYSPDAPTMSEASRSTPGDKGDAQSPPVPEGLSSIPPLPLLRPPLLLRHPRAVP